MPCYVELTFLLHMPNDNDGVVISGTQKRSHCTICIRTSNERSKCLIVECFCFDCVAFKMVALCNSQCLIWTDVKIKHTLQQEQANMARCSVRAAVNIVCTANRLRCQWRTKSTNWIACTLRHALLVACCLRPEISNYCLIWFHWIMHWTSQISHSCKKFLWIWVTRHEYGFSSAALE